MIGAHAHGWLLEDEPASGFHSHVSCTVNLKRLSLIRCSNNENENNTHPPTHPSAMPNADSKQRGAVKAVRGSIPRNLGEAPKTHALLQ